MKLKIHHIVIMLILVSCEKPIYIVPIDVHPYVLTFQEEAKIRGFDYTIDNIDVSYHDDSEMPYAMADTRIKNGRIIMRINTKYWDVYKDYPMRREAIIMHEFGHYPLMRGHNGVHESLMSGENWSIINYEHNRESMLDELFE